MDNVAENFEGVALPKVSVEVASGGLNMHQGISATPSLMQASFLPFSGSSSVNKSPSPVQPDPKQSPAFHIPIIPSGNVTPTATVDARAAGEVAVTSVEGPSTVVSSSPSSLPNDTAGRVVTPSSSSVLDFSSAEIAAGIALMAPSIPSSQVATIPTYSPSLTTSVPLATSTPYSSSHRIQAPSGTTLSASDARSESLRCSPAADAPQPPVTIPSSGVVGPNSSGPLLTPLPTSLAPAEVPVAHSEMSSSQAADTTRKEEIPSFAPIVLERQHQQRPSTVLPFSSSPTDNNTTASPMSTTLLRSESQLGAPCFSTSALPSPSESNLEISPSSRAALASPDVRETDPMDLSPVGASTGLLSEHERTSLGTSTSFPASGTSTITIPSPSLVSNLPPLTSPPYSISKIPNPLSVSSSNRSSSVRPMIVSSLLTDPTSSFSISTSYLALLSSVEKSSSSSPLAGRQMDQYPLTSSSLSSSPTFSLASTSNVIPNATVSSFPSQHLISNTKSSGNLDALTTVAPSVVSSDRLVPTSLNSSTVYNSASSNCASNTIQVSPSSLELKSFKEELTSKSGLPFAPTSETLPRRPVRGGQQGEGWPYAPQEWPEPDDKWTWRVGKRVHVNGYFRDRFLALPKSLCKGRKTTEFASKKSIVEYLKENFPDLSVENFFKSFQWRIPSYVNSWHSFSPSASKVNALKRQRPAEGDTDAPSLPKRSKQECKAGNPSCGLETGRSILLGGHSVLACDICCTEPGFCRECKCILCCKTIEPDFLESTFVRCVRKPSGNSMCGHAAHLECALHSKMAGVVKKRGLDMEYLCRRCDKRTDLRELVPLLLEAVGSTELRTQAEKSLELALEVMNGTERGGSGARVLDALVQTALKKVKSGVDIQEVFKELKEQGAAAAAEAARQQNLGRSSCLMEDASQQPEASLDQWLPSSGSPSSHPSPGTPSFTSPRLRSNPSVTSGQINGGTQTVDDSLRKHRAVEGHTDHSGEPQTCNEVVSNSKYKNSHLGNKSLIRTAGQARKSHSSRAVSSNVNNNGLEAICDSFTTGTPGNVAEPGSRDGNSYQRANQLSNSGTKNLKDLRNPSSGAGKLREENEMCKSVASTLRHHTSNAVEITSTLKSPKIEDGGKKVVKSSSTPREDEQGDCDAYKQVAKSDTGVDANGRSHKTCTTNGSGHKSMATSLQMLDRQCEQEMRVALQKLRLAQEAEFHRAEACLTAKKKSVLKKHELLEATRREFSEQPVSTSLEAFDELLIRTGNQFAGAKEERDNFKIMLKVADGFGCVSKDDLKKFYRWPADN